MRMFLITVPLFSVTDDPLYLQILDDLHRVAIFEQVAIAIFYIHYFFI